MEQRLCLAIVVSILVGCATPTKPNISVLSRISDVVSESQKRQSSTPHFVLSNETAILFRELYAIDQVLALEVGRLPEFEEKISQESFVALERFVRLVQKAGPLERENIAKLLEEGKPEVRKYCAPLQALLWILERENDEGVLRLPLLEILDRAWFSTGFEHDAPGRWNNFTTVAERLSSPFLIDYYEVRNFTYEIVGDPVPPPPATVIFDYKKGTCSFYTSFTVHCLKKAGYEARAVRVHVKGLSGWFARGDHIVCEYIDKDGDTYVMDNGRPFSLGIVKSKDYYNRYPKLGVGYNIRR